MRRLVTLLLIISFFQIYSQTEYSILTIPAELSKNANSVLVDELIEVDVTETNKFIYNSHRVVTVFNKKGDKHAGSYAYYDNDRKVKNQEVYVYDALGNEIEHFKKRDFKDVSATEGSLYSDDRLSYLDYIPTVYPYTLVYDYSLTSSTTAFIYDWAPLDGYASSTKKSVYKIKFDPTNKLKHNPQRLDNFDISIVETPNELVFTASNLKAIRYESMSKKFVKISPKVSFALREFYLNGVYADVENWEEFGFWVQNNLLNSVGKLPESAVKKAKNLIVNETTNEAKARVIYQFLQDKVRYISIQIGIGGWKPMLASDVDRLSYGDCKALTNYTKAMLDAVGIPSYYTILYSGANGEDVTSDFMKFQGDHVILGVPDGDKITWLECTSQDLPYGFLGDFTDDRDVLIITPEGGKIVHTPIYKLEDNLQDTKATIKIDENGIVTASFHSESKGLQYNNKYYISKKNNKDQTEHYANKWTYINGYNVENIQLTNDKKKVIFTEKLDVISSSYCSNIGKDLLFNVNVFNRLNFIPPRIKERKQEVFISEGFKDLDHYTITLSSNFMVEDLPENKIIENKFGYYKASFVAVNDKEIEYQREFRLKKGTYPPEDYTSFRNFMKQVSKLDKTKILLVKNK